MTDGMQRPVHVRSGAHAHQVPAMEGSKPKVVDCEGEYLFIFSICFKTI